jgi:hypothetical protein
MIKIDELMERIVNVERDLEEIERDFVDFPSSYDGDDFTEQPLLAVNLETRLTSITHEVASVIGFQREDIFNLCKYIEFRKMHSWFDVTELEQIIDTEMPSLELKAHLSNKIQDKTELLHRISNARREWNATFRGLSYKSVSANAAKN